MKKNILSLFVTVLSVSSFGQNHEITHLNMIIHKNLNISSRSSYSVPIPYPPYVWGRIVSEKKFYRKDGTCVYIFGKNDSRYYYDFDPPVRYSIDHDITNANSKKRISEEFIENPTHYYVKVTDSNGEFLKNGFHRFDFDGWIEVVRTIGNTYDSQCILHSPSPDLYKIRLYLKSDGIIVSEIITGIIDGKTHYGFSCSSPAQTTLLIDFK